MPLGLSQIGAYAIGQASPVNDPALVNGARLPLYTQPTPPPTFQANYWQGVNPAPVIPPTPAPIPPGPPTNPYVAEDDVTYYVAEDGVTYYVQEI